MLEGINGYAKCSECSDVLWTEVSAVHQAVTCTCSSCTVDESTVSGSNDETFGDAEMEAFLNGSSNVWN